MCSVEEGTNDDPLPKTRYGDRDNNDARLCFKCKGTPAVVVTRVNDPMCKDCFQVYTTHKFRSAIGKSKLVRDGERVLVAFSGGQASSALLHLIREGLSERAHKKLRFIPALVYVDEGSVFGLNMTTRSEFTQNILSISEETGFPCYILPIEDAIQTDFHCGLDGEQLSIKQNIPFAKTASVNCEDHRSVLLGKCEVGTTSSVSSSSPEITSLETGRLTAKQNDTVLKHTETELEKLLSTFKSLSSKEEFLRLLRERVILEVAKQHGYSKIMMGNCSTRLSVRMMTDIARGKGGHAALDTAFADFRDPDVTILRPLRDFSARDIAMFNVLFDVKSTFMPTLTTKTSTSASIEHATETFITGLQTDFPSTVSNIMRTAEKLVSAEILEQKPCSLCRGPLDTNVPLASALNAVEFSRSVSKKPISSDPEASCCGKGDGSCRASVPRMMTPEQLNAVLCYSCRITLGEMEEKDKAPGWLINDALQSVRRSEMRAEIQDYLLEELETS